jgi:hypothetical protein
MTIVPSALAALVSGIGAGFSSAVRWSLGQRMDVGAAFVTQWATSALWSALVGFVGAFLLRNKRNAFPVWSVVLALILPIGLGVASNLTAWRDLYFEPFSAPDLLERMVAVLCGPIASFWASVGGTLRVASLLEDSK